MLLNTVLRRLVALAVLLVLAPGVRAQSDEIGEGFNKPDAAEEQRLRALLAQPVPDGALFETLRRHFREKEVAAFKLGDTAQIVSLRREAVRRLPDPVLKNNLARELLGQGQVVEGNALMREAVAAANPYDGAYMLANIVCDLFNQKQPEAARAALAELAVKIKAAEPGAKADWQKRELFRATSRRAGCLAVQERGLARHAQAIAAAEEAELYGRKALALLVAEQNPRTRLFTHMSVADSIAIRLETYRMAGRLQDSEKALADYLRFAREVQLPADYLSGIYYTAGKLRFSQREFAEAERLAHKSEEVLAGLGRTPLHGARTRRVQQLIIALSGQRKWAEALREVERLDQLAGEDAKLKQQVRYPYERGVVYFGNRRYAEAAALFESVAKGTRDVHGATHFFTAQAVGMQGAALWRSGLAENQARALPLLKAAVRDYMAPANADYLENLGYRKERREEIFAAYLDALARTPGEDATAALGAADWVRGGVVQEALNDAAVRAAAATPQLAAVVRREQDAKHEIASLRQYLAGEAGAANSPLPQVAAQMRQRIAVLEEQRITLHAEIKAGFPDYAQLVRPTPPTVAEIARQLAPEQALLLLLPTPEAVYVWAVAADRPAAFVRAGLDEAQVGALVRRLRRDLDFAAGADASRFDSAAAFALYDALLAPLAAVWRGKTQLVVAAGGALSQLPFAVLQTRPGGGFDAAAPWLIRDAAIAQVPSLTAWLAIKSLARNSSAPQAFLGWGDPLFAARQAGAAPTRNLALQRVSPLADLEAPEKPLTTLKYSEIPPLPDTRDELLAIAGVLRASAASDVLLGAAATRTSVLAASGNGQLANRRVVAFATHGLMAGDLPNLNQPALAMAALGGEQPDPLAPLLTLEDILTLKLNADWVVLSACNTAAADGRAEEALSGLARGFFYAGSRSLLVTHWSVDSESAKRLTTATFEHYATHPTSPKAESLRQAMLKLMTAPGYRHPAYWAPYSLVGDGGR